MTNKIAPPEDCIPVVPNNSWADMSEEFIGCVECVGPAEIRWNATARAKAGCAASARAGLETRHLAG